MTEKSKNLLHLDQGVFIVAEIGKAFIQTEDDKTVDEYIANAKNLIQAAKEAGADAVKFQTHNVEDEQLNIPISAPHFSSASRYAWVKRNTEAAPLEFWQEIKRYSDELDIMFFSTPMSRGAAQKLAPLNLPLWKVASSDILDFVLLDYIAQGGQPIIISSGMSTLEELDKATSFLKKRTNDIIILHCVSKYPCPKNELYLNTIPYFIKRYDVPVGFSDHSIGYEAAAAAVSLGASVIEKHFSFSRDLWGSDHKVSMTPDEFKQMVGAIRGHQAPHPSQFGQGIKALDESESAFRPIFRKSLMAGQDIPAGTVITKGMVYAMRPQQYAGGLPSEAYENVLGKQTNKNLRKYDPLTNEVLI